MNVSRVSVESKHGGFRASAVITSEGGPNGELWFEVCGGARPPTEEMAASAFLATCLPVAVWLESDLHIEPPVDREFLLRVPILARGHARLHARNRTINVHATGIDSPAPADRVVGQSFSGGVDSFYTLKANSSPDGVTPVRALVTGLGLDTPVDDHEGHATLMARLGSVSDELGLAHYTVRTNFRPFFDPYADPSRVTQGACLVAFAFLLSGSLHTYLIPASAPVDRLYRWSSHAVLDNAWISKHLRTVSDGWDIHRNDKLAEIAEWPIALRNIRVCTRGRGVENCGRCEKCVRTMALLELAGKGAEAPFPQRLNADLIRALRIKDTNKLYWWGKIRALARRNPEFAWLATAIKWMSFRVYLRAPKYRLRTWRRGNAASTDRPVR